MTRRSRATLAAVAVLAIAAVGVIQVLPPDTRLGATRIGVFVVGITIATLYLRRSGSVTASTPERFEVELRQPKETLPSVAGLRAVEMTVRLSTANATDFDVRLRPLLRDLARWRLLANRGVDMDRAPDVARRVMGEPLNSLIDEPDEPVPFRSPGVPLVRIDAALDQLEQI